MNYNIYMHTFPKKYILFYILKNTLYVFLYECVCRIKGEGQVSVLYGVMESVSNEVVLEQRSISPRGREEKEAGLGRGRWWAAAKSQWRNQPTSRGALELGGPFRVVLSLCEGAEPLSPHVNKSLGANFPGSNLPGHLQTLTDESRLPTACLAAVRINLCVLKGPLGSITASTTGWMGQLLHP